VGPLAGVDREEACGRGRMDIELCGIQSVFGYMGTSWNHVSDDAACLSLMNKAESLWRPLGFAGRSLP
jgi:hypothetical protein